MKSCLNLILFSIFILLFISCKKGSSNTTNTKPVVYITGLENGKATIWKNGVATTLGDGSSINGKVVVKGNDVYVSGGSLTMSGAKAFYYKNGTRIDLGAGETFAIAVNGADVYLAGMILDANGNSEAAYWKNGILTNLNIKGVAYAIAVSGNDLYIAGETTVNSTEGITATYWKNGNPVNLGSGLISSIAIDGNNVYLGGYSINSYTTSGGYWKNGNFITIDHSVNSDIYDIKVSEGNVYLVGLVVDNGNNSAAYWKNGAITVYKEFAVATGVAISSNDVYVAGCDYLGAGSSHNCYLWKNNTATTFSGDGDVESIFVTAN